ncbi:hypothetical protein ALC60_09751, partial [Trachymyrmex zeteki]
RIWISACCRRRSNHHIWRLTLRRWGTAHHHSWFSKGVNLCGCERGGGGFPARYARRSSLRIIRLFFLAQFIISLQRFCLPISTPKSLHRLIQSTESI